MHNRTITPRMLIRPSAASGATEILVYGLIGESLFSRSVDAEDFAVAISGIDADALIVRINSRGGSVVDGAAIYNAIRQHPAAKKTTQVDGEASSIASLIAMAGDRLSMFANSTLMIHSPWAGMIGNEFDFRDAADTLHTYAEAMATSYAAKSGKTTAEILALFGDRKDHIYTAASAMAAGFCDEIIDAESPSSEASVDQDESVEVTEAVTAEIMRAFRAQAPAIAAQMQRNAFNVMAGRDSRQTKAAETRTAKAPCVSADRADPDQPHKPNYPSGNSAAHQREEANMKDTTAEASAQVTQAAAVAASTIQPTAADVHAALRARNDEIKAMLEPYMQRKGINDLYVAALTDPSTKLDDVRAKALELVGREAAPAAGSHVEAGADEADKFRDGVSSALLIRAGFAKNDGANPFRGHALREIARACVERTGRNTRGLDIREVVALGFTTSSDFQLLLGNTAKTSLLKGYTEAPESYPLFTRAGTLSDFKEVARAGLGIFSALDEVPEGGEYKYGTFGENGQKVKLATYGKMFAITRQAIINDDLGAFTTVPEKMGRAAKRTIGNLVFEVLTSNPTMADGFALFESAHHGNLLTGSGITSTSVDAMDAAMGVQTGPDGQPVNIPLAYLIVPRALKGAANLVRTSEFEVGAATRNNSTPNIVRDSFGVIADARLDKVSASVWYGSADPQLADTIEVSYLDGQQEPYTDQKDGWDVDGTEFKVRIDAGVHPIDYRGLAKNPGA